MASPAPVPPSAPSSGQKIAAPAPKPQLPLASPGKRRWMMHGDLRPVPGLGPVGCTSAAAAPLRRGRSPTSTARPRRGAAQLDSASSAVAEPQVSSFPGGARWTALLPPPLRCATGGRQPQAGRGAARLRFRPLPPSRCLFVPGPGPVDRTSAAAAPLHCGRSPTSTARPGRGAAQLDSASYAVAE